VGGAFLQGGKKFAAQISLLLNLNVDEIYTLNRPASLSLTYNKVI